MFIVHTPNGQMEFICHPRVLHYLNPTIPEKAEIIMAMTLQEKLEGYTKRPIEDAKKQDDFRRFWATHHSNNTKK